MKEMNTDITEKMTIRPKLAVSPIRDAAIKSTRVAMLVVELAIPFTSPLLALGIKDWRNSVSPILKP